MEEPTDEEPTIGAVRNADLDLVRGALEREPASLDGLMRRMQFVSRVLAVRNLRSGSPLGSGDLEDLAQDVHVALWKKLPSFDGRVRLETWVYSFCYLEFLRRLRSRRTRGEVVAATESSSASSSHARESREPDDYEVLYLALAHVRPEEAHIVQLKHFEELTFDQIGERLAISPNTAKTRYYRSLDKLREFLEKRTGDAPARRPS